MSLTKVSYSMIYGAPYNVLDYGATGDGVTNDSAAFEAVDALGPFVVPAGTYKISSDITIDNNVVFQAGAILSVDSGKTVTFLSPVNAPDTQIFSGSGSVSLLSKQIDVNVIWFGAKGDGSTDDTVAIQAAINSSWVINFPSTANGYKISTATLSIPSNRKLVGDFAKTKIVHVYDGWLFDIKGSYIEIDGFQIDSSATTLANSGIIRLRTDLSSVQRLYFSNIESSSAHYFAKDMNSTGNIVELYFTHCIAKSHKGPGIDLRDTFGYLRLEDCTIDYVGITASNFRAYRLDNNQGSTWINCDVTGGTVDGTTSSQDGFFFNNCVAVWMNNCMADTVGGNGFYLFDGCRYFYLVNCVASLCDRTGFGAGAALGNTSYQIRLSNCTVAGRRLMTYKTSSVDGYEFDGCDIVQLSNCESVDCTGDGYYMNGTTKYNLSNCRADTNTLWGFESSATGDGIVTGSSFNSNGSGNVNLATANDYVESCIATSGALFSLQGPGTA